MRREGEESVLSSQFSVVGSWSFSLENGEKLLTAEIAGISQRTRRTKLTTKRTKEREGFTAKVAKDAKRSVTRKETKGTPRDCGSRIADCRSQIADLEFP